MFPTYGLFQNYLCPDNDTNCFRPYCHFYHAPNKRVKQKVSDVKTFPVQIEPLKVHQSVEKHSNFENKDASTVKLKEFEKSTVDNDNLGSKDAANISNENPSTSSSSDTAILQKLISEAVKKVIAESSSLNLSNLDSNSILEKLDASSLVAKAVQQVSLNPKLDRTASASTESNGKNLKLYLPPPDTPKYTPTPVHELQLKKSNCSESVLQIANNEYIPTSVIPRLSSPLNRASEDSEITDFSSSGEEEDRRSDFDLLEEVLAEHSSNPIRSKEIRKRKKALSKKILSELPVPGKYLTTENKKLCKEDKNCDFPESKKDNFIEPFDENSFLPPSPIFTSSSELTLERNNLAEKCSNLKYQRKSISYSSGNPTSLPIQDGSSIIQEVSSACKVVLCPEEPDSIPVNSHTLVSHIAVLTRPNTKVWTPVAKPSVNEPSVHSVEAVEMMLEKLDSFSNSTEENKNSLKHPGDTVQNDGLEENDFCSSDKETNLADSLTEDSEKSTTDADHLDQNRKKKSRKRSCSSSSISSETKEQRRRKKKKRVHKKDGKSKKKRKQDYLSDSEYYTSDSEESEKRHSKFKSKRSKHKSHHHKKKSSHKHKKRKIDKKKSSYAKDSTSEEDSDEIQLIDPSCIKKEKEEDLDVFIVKIENPPKNVPKIESMENKEQGESALLDTAQPELNQLKVQSITQINANDELLVPIKKIVPLDSLKKEKEDVVNLGGMLDSTKEDQIEIEVQNCNIKKELPDINNKKKISLLETNKEQKSKLTPLLQCKTEKDDRPTASNKLAKETPTISMFESVIVKLEQTSKPRVLTEISMFDKIPNTDSQKHTSKSVCKKSLKSIDSSKNSKSNKSHSKNDDTITKSVDKHNRSTSTLSVNSAEKSSNNSLNSKVEKYDLKTKSKEDNSKDKRKVTHRLSTNIEEKQSKSEKHSNKLNINKEKESKTEKHSTDKERRQSKTLKHKNDKSADIKKNSEHSSYQKLSGSKIRASDHHENKKMSCKSKDNSETKNYKTKYDSKEKGVFSDSSFIDSKSVKSDNAANSHQKGSSRSGDRKSSSNLKDSHKERRKHESKRRHSSNSRHNGTISKSGSNLEDGDDSPIPDLSALDELPKEDWDHLLSCNTPEPLPVVTKKEVVTSDSDEGIDNEPVCSLSDDGDTEDGNDPKVMEECMKLFSEYDSVKASQPVAAIKSELVTPKVEPEAEPIHKQRVARTGAAGNLISVTKPLVKPIRKTPTEVMLERYQKLKEEEKTLQKKLDAQRKALEQHTKTSHNALSAVASISNSSVTSTSDCKASKFSSPVSTLTKDVSKKRIARAPTNVQAMLKSMARMKKCQSVNTDEVSTSVAPKSTIAMSSAKGSTRVAHLPTVDVLVKPTVNIEGGTKVPQNIRQRYLNCFIEEALKFCDESSYAFKVALAEEKICHQRANTRMVYLNIAVNIIKKLRAFQISEAAMEILQNDPELADNVIESSPQVTSSSSQSNSGTSSHPINPNHRVVSHFSVIAAGGNKGSWSIKSKKPMEADFKEILSESKFPKYLQKYILTLEQLEENGFPRPDPDNKGKAYIKKPNTRKKVSPSESKRYCDRCSALYEVDPWGIPISSKPCVYHWGRPYKRRAIGGGLESKYSCCQGDNQTDGCCMGTTHVSENFSPDLLLGYVKTLPKEPKKDGYYGVYALDCEMCYTTSGNELTRITVIDSNKKCVYETLVLPDNPIIDYNTRFSGITAEQMEGVKVTLRDVQATLLTLFSEKTILMGHSLESDFAALKLIHDTVLDTSIVFPHKLGAPYKRALRNLASEYLEKIIQNDVSGHDSAEDAITCMELMQWKVKDDFKLQALQGH